jgi:hypothetical protein
MDKDREKYYAECFVALKNMRDEMLDMNTLPDSDLDRKLDRIFNDIENLLSEVKLIVENQDKEKLQKWIDNSK